MNIRKYMNENKGMTLIELMVVIGILAMVAAIGFTGLRDMRNKTTLDKAASDVYVALQKAQSLSASGFGTTETSYGVRIVNDGIFPLVKTSAGVTAGAKETLPSGTSTDQPGTDIIFKRLISTTDGVYTIKINGGDKTIKVEKDGKITLR